VSPAARSRWEALLALVVLAQLATSITVVARHPEGDPVWRTIAVGPCAVSNLGASEQLAEHVLASCGAAVPVVTAVWGRDWDRTAVLVVGDTATDLPDVAAQVQDGRVFINAEAFAELSPAGRDVVITHEVTHLATGAVRGRGVPTWLLEGFADYVGYLHARIPVRVAAQELAAEVAAGRVPAALPSEASFDGPRQPSAYEQSWLAVSLLVRSYGERAVVRLYRAVASGTSLDRALPLLLHLSVAELTRAWQAELQRVLR
jgi:hypothetical protein